LPVEDIAVIPNFEHAAPTFGVAAEEIPKLKHKIRADTVAME
jgi:hypothetical protein